MNQWLKEIRVWKETYLNKDILTWVCCYGMACHVWCLDCFETLSSPIEVYLCSNGNTSNQVRFNISRILVGTTLPLVMNKTFDYNINGVLFGIHMVEDNLVPLKEYLDKKLVSPSLESE